MVKEIASAAAGFFTIPLTIAAIVCFLGGLSLLIDWLGQLPVSAHHYWAGFATFIGLGIIGGVVLSFVWS